MTTNDSTTVQPNAINSNIHHPFAMLTVMMAGSLIAVISVSLLLPSIPLIMKDLGINASDAQWISTSFTIANAIMVPLSVFMNKRFSVRFNYITAVLLFAIASFVGAFTSSYAVLLLSRIVQGLSTGCLMPMTQIAVTKLFPKDRQGAMLGYVGIAIAAGPAIGTPLAGIMMQHMDWHTLFIMLGVLSSIELLLCILILQNLESTQKASFDFASIVFTSISISCFILATSSLSSNALLSFKTLAPVLLTVAALIMFIRRQNSLATPLLDINTFKTKRYAIAAIISIATPTTQLAGNFLIPLSVQNIYEGTVLDSAMILLPGALVMTITSPLIGRLYDLFGFRKIGIMGFALLTICNLGLAHVPGSHPYIYMSVLQFIRSIGLGSLTMPTLSWALDSLSDDIKASGSVIFHVIRMVSCAFGPALVATIVVRTQTAAHMLSTFESTALGISTANTVLGVLTGLAMITTIIATSKKTNL